MTPLKRFVAFWTAPRIAGGFLVLSLLVGCAQVYWHNFIDEGDNIAVGILISQGRVLYRDVFSHHFPFPYYWVAFVARFLGESILAFRLSLLLFQTAAFGVAIWLTPFRVALGMTALVWRIIGFPYYGNMLVYPNFSGAALLPVFAIALAAACGQIAVRSPHVFAVGLFSAVGILSDPLAIYPVSLSLVVLAASPAGLKSAAKASGVIFAVCTTYVVFLLMSGSLTSFVRDAVRFNVSVYSKYRPVDPVPYRQVLRVGSALLDVFDPRWARLSSTANPYLQPDRRLLTGFLYRGAVIAAAAVLLAQRKVLAAVFVYAMACILIAALGEERFRAIPFVFMALFTAAWLVTGEGRAGQLTKNGSRCVRSALMGAVLFWLIRGSLAAGLCVLSVTGAYTILENRRARTYAANYAGYERRAETLRQLSCGRSDVALGYYPSDPLIHVFTRMRPVSRYLFLLPWVAEAALPEVIEELDDDQLLAVVFVDIEGHVWGQPNREYLAPLISFLDQRYTRFSAGLYRSPALAAQCPIPGSR